jgi:lipid-binding SYLF domain-containing protein
MGHSRRKLLSALVSAGVSIPFLDFTAVAADTAKETDQRASGALKKLYQTEPLAKDLSTQAKGILVFPKITKAGFLVGGAYGEGELLRNGKTVGYYSSIAGSYGLQVGVQWFGYALFLMTDEALQYLDNANGWEIGLGPSVVVVDKGMAKKHSSTTLTQDAYAFIFDQKGLMAGLGIEGSKISKVRS